VDRPHVLVFVTDDHGAWALGCAGCRDLVAPTLDHLAASGARLPNAFTPCPVCSPARASLLTGLLPSQHGVHDWLRWDVEGQVHPGIDGLPHLGLLLGRRGYWTGLVGKWHLGRDHLPRPGFDRWFSYQVSQTPHLGRQRFSDQGRPVETDGYQVELLTEEAVRFLRERPRDRPFFLYVGFVAPHTPHRDQPRRWVDRYRAAAFADVPDRQPSPAHGWARYAWPEARSRRREELAQYYAAVSFVDEAVGRILDELEAQGVREDTLVVYTSDHGHLNGHYGLHTKGNATVPQNFLDGSIRVPCLLSWPRGVPAGRILDAPVDHLDLFATVLDATGGWPDPGLVDPAPYPGTSFLPLLRGVPHPWRDAVFAEYGNARMVRTSRWKLVRRYPGPNGAFPDELYDLLADPEEDVDRAGDPALAEVRRALEERLEAHFARYEDPARSGRRIAELPRCNGSEPWYLAPGQGG
jgi:choline-sulfatase